MKKYLLFYFSIILFNSSNGQYFKFANTIDGKHVPYGITGTTWNQANSVFKLDASGNTVWVKDFSGFLVSTTFPNQLIGSAFDGTFLYVLEIQGLDFGSGPPHTYYPAIIKMDTLGNVIFVVNAAVQPGGSYNVIDIYPSLTNGIWLLDDYAPGFTHYGNALYFNNLGQAGINLGFWYGSVASPRDFHILVDSNYVVCVNHRPSSFPGETFPALTKFDLTGNILWRTDFTISGGTMNDYFAEQAMTLDSSGNIYLICICNKSGIPGAAGIKISSGGNLITSKFWTTIDGTIIQSLKYENGGLICTVNDSDIYFDNQFNNSCLSSQNLALTQGNHYMGGSYLQQYASASFTPVNGPAFSYTPTANINYCGTTSIVPLAIHQSFFEIVPNPATSLIHIITDLNEAYSLKITDLRGRVLLQKDNAKEIDVSKLQKGVYLITLRSSEGVFQNKFSVD